MTSSQEIVEIARSYYDSEDADRFYATVWGGEDIHVGLYAPGDSVAEASHETVRYMASLLPALGRSSKVLDLGSGYGGAARFLARESGCAVVGLNLSDVENQRARTLNREQGLDDLVEIVTGNFESVPYPDAHFDVVWSQDAFLHSGEREKAIAEAARVLKPEGTLIFTDPMRADECPEGVLDPILARIHLSDLGHPSFYREAATRHGMKEIGFQELTHQLVNHYQSVLVATREHEASLSGHISSDYLSRMKTGLQHWIDGGNKGYLRWGIFRFQRM